MSTVLPNPPSDRSSGRADLLHALATGTSGVVGDAFLHSLVGQAAAALNADVAFIAEHLADREGWAHVLASWDPEGDMPPGSEFPLDERMPCAVLLRQDVFLMRDGACACFPGDRFLVAHGLESYLGIALRASDGERVGHIGLMSRSRLEPSEDEIAALQIFGARAGAEIERRRHLATLRAREAEVAAARTRMLHAADEERRRIGRELHDGVQQRLVALRHLVTLLERSAGDALPGGATALLERLGDETRLAADELRELARGLHPAGLSERGLQPVLDALAERSPVPLRIERLPDRRLPDPVEVTVYALVSEALTNAHRYADATEVVVSFVEQASSVVVEVSDDGRGGARPADGTGLRGLGDRVAALGGELTIDSPPGQGTRLRAVVPLAPWRTPREPFLEFGDCDDDGQGERSIGAILEGRKRAALSLAAEWQLEGGVPAIGQRLPVRDHLGRTRATVEVERVAIYPFCDIPAEVVHADAVEPMTVEQWREKRRRRYARGRDQMAVILGDPAWGLRDDEPMVVLWFSLVDARS